MTAADMPPSADPTGWYLLVAVLVAVTVIAFVSVWIGERNDER